MTGCHVCGADETRRYLTGPCCPLHTPAAFAGRPEPAHGDGTWIAKCQPTPKFTALDFALKTYVSKQRAVKIAEQRDAIRGAA